MPSFSIKNLESIEAGRFPSKMKSVDMIPGFEKENRMKEYNHRPIAMLQNGQKILRDTYTIISLCFSTTYHLKDTINAYFY